jgi:uncharacterized protein YkwD
VNTGCEQRLVNRTNATRAQHGLAPLQFDGRVHGVSRGWSQHMADAGGISHNPNFGGQMSAAGVQWWIAGENVGVGGPDRVFDMWMSSPAHRDNILRGDYTAFAIACIEQGGSVWITQNFYG